MSKAPTLYDLRDALRRYDERSGRPARKGFTIADMLEAQDLDKPKLLCDRCRRRKLRTEFRETPWHGRAAACRDCEGSRYLDEIRERMAWQLEQEQERSRALRRHITHLKLKLLYRPAVTSGDVMREVDEDIAARRQRFADAWEPAFIRLLLSDCKESE